MSSQYLTVVHDLTRSQHGVVASWQLGDFGVPEKARHRLVCSGKLERLSSQVLMLPGLPPSRLTDIMAAVLDAGPAAVVSHETAAELWEIKGPGSAEIHVSRPYAASSRRQTLGRLHEVRDLPEVLLAKLDQVPIARPELALFQLAGRYGRYALGRAIDDAWAQGLVNRKGLQRALDLMKDRGRKGTVLFRELLEGRPADWVPFASAAEARFSYLLEVDGQEPMLRQVDIADEEGWIGRVDFGDEVRPFFVEVLGARHHSALTDRQDDQTRLERLRASGKVVVGIWDFQLWQQGNDVARVVRRVRQLLDAGVAPSSELLAFTRDLHERTVDGTSIADVLDAWYATSDDPQPPF